jgi:RNA polymerase sigma factor (sigma-70 family)
MDESNQRLDSSPVTTGDFTVEEDAELLTYISWKTEYPGHARSAWAVFYARHIPFVYKVCLKVTKGTRLESHAEDLAADTMIRAFEKAGSYRDDRTLDPHGRRRRVRAWLSAIAENIINDVLRGQPLDREIDVGPDRWREFQGPANDEFVSTNFEIVEAVEEAFRTALDEREAEVLRVTMHYYDGLKKNQRLPNDVADDLARRLDTTSENLRKIRERAKKKVREFLITKFGTDPL